jgi:hypothetical protein
MKKKSLSNLLLAFGAISLAIAIYQFLGSRTTGGILSVVYGVVFIAVGLANRRA